MEVHMHRLKDLCKGILSMLTSSAAPLEIKQSLIDGAGSGLFTTANIPEHHDVFRSQPLVNCRDPSTTYVCDYCLVNNKSMVHRADGRFRTDDEKRPTVMPCSGCKVARYCSTVSTTYHHQPVCLPIQGLRLSSSADAV